MEEVKNHPQNAESAPIPSVKEQKIAETEEEKFAAPHIGSSDAFLQTENPASPDADNISDEKLDDMLDED